MKMPEHKFGGDWTEIKLSRLREYLIQYRRIFTSNPRARYFKTWYVDAFAGTGSRSAPKSATLQLDYGDGYLVDDDTSNYLDGSAKIALGLPSPFDQYLFIEESRKRAEALQESVLADFSALADRVNIKN